MLYINFTLIFCSETTLLFDPLLMFLKELNIMLYVICYLNINVINISLDCFNTRYFRAQVF